MAPKYSQNTIFNMASVRHLEFAKFQFFLTNTRPENWNLYLLTKFYLNWINHGWDIEIKLFSKWRPSAILNLRKLPYWSRDLYLHVIFHLYFKFRINWPIWRRDIAKKRFSIWRPSAILNLQNFNFVSNLHPRNGNLHPHTKFDRNRKIHSWDMEIMLFSKWRPSAILNFGKLQIFHVTCIGMWFFISDWNFALIDQ